MTVPAVPRSQRPRLFYGYVIMAASFVIQILSWGFYNSYGVFFSPLLAEFGWSRATLSGSLSLSQIVYGLGATILGRLNDRFGPRLLMTLCGFTLGLGFFLLSFVHSTWQLYLFNGVIVGLGISGTDVILLSTAARWFVRRRGMMSGIMKIGTGVGIVIAPLIVVWLISGYGWRSAFAVIGLAVFVVGISAAQFLRRDPAQVGQLPDGREAVRDAPAPPPETGLSLGQAVHTRRFWMLYLSWPLVLFCTISVVIHLPPYAVDLGFPESFGATLISIIGGTSIAGRLVMGIAGDRTSYKLALLTCFAVMAATFAWLLVADKIWSLLVFALVYGFCHGGFYALYSPAVAEFFGTRSHGLILGILILSGSVGGFLGPIVTGHIFDTTASYHAAFILWLVLTVVGFILMLMSGRSGRNRQIEGGKI